MAYWNQRTVAKRVTATGIGLHSGHPVTLTLAPAPADAGVTFVRMDLGAEVPARNDHVVDTRLNTTVGVGNARVSTVEHVMAALQGMGIDNCRVEVDGPEMPVLDGSAAPFVCMIREAGVQVQRAGRRFVVIDRPVEVRDGDKLARLEPSDAFRVSFTADFDHPLVSNQTIELAVNDRTFEREIARARTFCFRRDIEKMQAMGLAKGGSLENAVVVDDFSIVNPEGLRFADEMVRHKVLDAIGDLALLGLPVVGALTAVKSGHAMNQALVKKVLADPACHRIVRVSGEAEATAARIAIPGAFLPEGQAA
ncbi:MAG TPA: UDP-3-O-acyl-N-acetylglucosamine deacetylase [Anaeromyxobacteraceae bacterium]|nr:UDP-3-O-acyl-N-acetylglucosamine deacetylase [Anaeromyxobacteraceae bacterium]